MYIDYKLEGTHINLRSVSEDDAEDILKLRNNPQLTAFLPPLNITVEQQKAWILNQRLDNDSYYFIIEKKNGECIGTIGFYDIHDEHAETGRYCCIGEAQHSIESFILQSDFVYDVVGLSYLIGWVYEDNKPVVSLTEKYGFEWIEYTTADDGRKCRIGKQTKDMYLNKRGKILKLLKNIPVD